MSQASVHILHAVLDRSGGIILASADPKVAAAIASANDATVQAGTLILPTKQARGGGPRSLPLLESGQGKPVMPVVAAKMKGVTPYRVYGAIERGELKAHTNTFNSGKVRHLIDRASLNAWKP